PGWQAWLDEAVEEHGFSMVIIDTLSTTAGELDTDRSSELMSQMLKPLKVIAKKNDTAIAVVHHNKKSATEQKGSRAGNDMLGSVRCTPGSTVRSMPGLKILQVSTSSGNRRWPRMRASLSLSPTCM